MDFFWSDNFLGCFCRQAKLKLGETMLIIVETKIILMESKMLEETITEEVFSNLGRKGMGFFEWGEDNGSTAGSDRRLTLSVPQFRGQWSVQWYFIKTRSKERFEMLKEVNLHRKHFNRKRCSNNGAGRPNSFMGSGTIPATPKLGNKTNCAKLHFLIISRSRFKKFILTLHLTFSY